MSEKIRTFIAIELPEEVINLIRTVQDQLKSEYLDFTWVKPENIHLTLRFLGDVSTGVVDQVAEAMEKAAEDISFFRLVPKGLGAFPGLNRPRVLWMGLDGETSMLQKLHQGLGNHLEALGFEKEKRSFKGHLTLGRSKGRIDPVKMIDVVGKYKDYSADAFTVNKVVLFKSDLKPGGAVYEKIRKANLFEFKSGGQT